MIWLLIIAIITCGLFWIIKSSHGPAPNNSSFKDQLYQSTTQSTPSPKLSPSWINFLREFKTHWAIFIANQARKKGYKKHQQKIAENRRTIPGFGWIPPAHYNKCCDNPNLAPVNQGRYCLSCRTLLKNA